MSLSVRRKKGYHDSVAQGGTELIRRAASAYGDSESDDEKTGNLCV